MPGEMDSLKAITKGAAIVFFGLIISKIITYFFVMFAARYFGPEPYGIYSLGIAIMSFLSLVFLLGMQKGVVRYVAFFRARKQEKKVKGVITSALRMSSLISIAVFVAMFFLSDSIALLFNEPRLAITIRIFALALPFLSVSNILSSVLKAFRRNDYDVIAMNITNNLFSLVFIVVFWYLGFTFYGVSIGWTIGTVIAFFAGLFLVQKVYPVFRNPIESAHVSRELLAFSVPLLLVSAMWMVISWTDTVMLGFFNTVGSVGIYNVALPTARLLYAIPTAFTVIFLPVASGLFSIGKTEQMKHVYRTVTKWIFYLTFPALLIFSLFSRQIISILFGANYVSGALPLVVLSVGFFILAILSISNNVLITMKKTKTVAFHTVSAAALNVALNVLLIPIYGIYGAALATASSFFLWRGLDLVNAYRCTRFNPFSGHVMKSVLAGLISIGLIYILSVLWDASTVYLLLCFLLIFILVYFALLALLRGFDRNDIEILKLMEKRAGLELKLFRKIIKKFLRA